jgi:hypothetical protein
MEIGSTVLVEGKEVIIKKVFVDEKGDFMIGYELDGVIELRYFHEVQTPTIS